MKVESTAWELAASAAAAGPRVVALAAPEGYGKGAFLRSLAERVGRLVVCDLAPDAAAGDLARSVLDALVANDPARAARSAADRLAQRREVASATARESLRREWLQATTPELFVLRDMGGMLATLAGVDLFEELIGTLPSARVLAVSTRVPLPPALLQIASREPILMVGSAELALRREHLMALADDAGVSTDAALEIYRLAAGWPLVSRLLIGLAREDGTKVLDAARSLPSTALLSFSAHRTIARLDTVVRDALVVSVLLREASHADLVRVLGDLCDDVVFAHLAELPFVLSDGESVVVHPDVATIVRARFATLFKSLYERTLAVLAGDGAYTDAARIALDAGDVTRAAAIIDAAPPYTAAPLPLGMYERVINRIDNAVVTAYPNLWIATIPYRAFAVDRSTFVHEAETVYFCLPHGASADQRAAALMHLANAYTNVGRFAESDTLLDEALHGFAATPSAARSALLNFVASLRGMEGRFTLARALATEAASIGRHRFGESQVLQYIDAHEAAFRGQNDRVAVIFEELLRRLATAELPSIRANTATNGAFFAWMNGDDERFGNYVSILEDSLTPGVERGFAPIIDAARGRSVQLDDGYPWPVLAAIAHLYRMGTASDAGEALLAARAAARAADERRDPIVQILAHVALYVLDESARTHEATVLEAIVAPIESAEMRDAVRALIDGEPAGVLEPYVRLRVRRAWKRREPRLVLELLAGRVTRDGVPVRLTDKEYELLALLGSSHGALSRDRIGEALWDHLDPEEWSNNLKVTLSRVRAKVEMRDAVIASDGRYRLSPAIDVDLRQAASVVREYGHDTLDAATRERLEAILVASRTGATGRYERASWVQPLRARLEDLVCGAAAALAADAFARERYDDALAYAGDVAGLDPFNESACESTIRVLLARGEIDGARRHFRRYAAALARELGTEPSPRLADLVRSFA